MDEQFENPIDKAIREAREKGAFESLSGKGKPLQWGEDALVPDDQRMANQVLKNAGFVPDWIQESQEIEQEYEDARADLRRALAARSQDRLDEPGWMAAQLHYRERISALNRRIQRYNLKTPSPQLQRRLYNSQPPSEP